VRYLLKDDASHPYFVKSDQADPTLYISSLPQFAQEFKEKQKGIVFLSSNFIVGLFGDPSKINMKELEEASKTLSSKPAKIMVKDKVTYKFKEKGKKEINVSGVLQFMISGADMNVEKLAETLSGQGIKEME